MAPTPSYPNRSDLRSSADRGTYGEGVARQQQARAMPPGRAPSEDVPMGPPPGSRGPLTRPTERPDEPITAGLPVGEGPGTEALDPLLLAPPQPGTPQAILETLRAVGSIAPNANFLAVLSLVERQAGGQRPQMVRDPRTPGLPREVGRTTAGSATRMVAAQTADIDRERRTAHGAGRGWDDQGA